LSFNLPWKSFACFVPVFSSAPLRSSGDNLQIIGRCRSPTEWDHSRETDEIRFVVHELPVEREFTMAQFLLGSASEKWTSKVQRNC
jgi:hypothetical protein